MKSNFQSEYQAIKQVEIAAEWEQIENALKKNNFWHFLRRKDDEISNRIDYVFSLAYKVEKLKDVPEEEFEAKNKLYELEDRFSTSFIRVNKSMLVNLEKIVSIQSKVLGNPQIVLSNETTVPVSRNYFKLLKEALGLGRESR